ncbi:MAG: NUDIX hydrolase [Clostridia bacterium]|nr:NUDIX hydrolase [Clostridia bacterium]
MADFSGLRETPLRDEVVFRGSLIDVIRRDVALPGGGTSLREIVRHPGGAAAVPVDEDGVVTLVRQHRVAPDLMTLEIPAGKLDSPDEDPLLAARRELEEEAGLRARHVEWLTTILPTPGYSTERLYLYLATGLTPCQTHLDADEFVDAVKMPLHEAVGKVCGGEITDGKTALALLLARDRLQACREESPGPTDM